MIIHQGDQYLIPIKITSDGTKITPSNCVDVRVKIGENQKSYVNGELTWDATQQAFMFPLTETDSFSMESSVGAQAAVKFNATTDFIYTAVSKVPLSKSIIKGAWEV